MTKTFWENEVKDPNFSIVTFEIIDVEEIGAAVYKINLLETRKDGTTHKKEIEINTVTGKLHTTEGSTGTKKDKLELFWSSDKPCTKSNNRDCNPLWWSL